MTTSPSTATDLTVLPRLTPRVLAGLAEAQRLMCTSIDELRDDLNVALDDDATSPAARQDQHPRAAVVALVNELDQAARRAHQAHARLLAALRHLRPTDDVTPSQPSGGHRCTGCGKTSHIARHDPGCTKAAAFDAAHADGAR